MSTTKRLGIQTVAVYSDADRHSLHVKSADEAVRIGPPPARSSYLNASSIIEAVVRTGAQTIHLFLYIKESHGIEKAFQFLSNINKLRMELGEDVTVLHHVEGAFVETLLESVDEFHCWVVLSKIRKVRVGSNAQNHQLQCFFHFGFYLCLLDHNLFKRHWRSF